jgi:hypothetical protein
VLLLGFGVWDMQYPAGIPAGHAVPADIAAGIEAFNRSLHTFTAALHRVWPTLAPGPAHRDGGGGGYAGYARSGGGGGGGGGGGYAAVGGGGDGGYGGYGGGGEQRGGRPRRRAKQQRLPRVLWLTVSTQVEQHATPASPSPNPDPDPNPNPNPNPDPKPDPTPDPGPNLSAPSR